MFDALRRMEPEVAADVRATAEADAAAWAAAEPPPPAPPAPEAPAAPATKKKKRKKKKKKKRKRKKLAIPPELRQPRRAVGTGGRLVLHEHAKLVLHDTGRTRVKKTAQILLLFFAFVERS